MSVVPSADLERELRVLIEKCDVTTTSVKSIRQQLEGSLGVDLKAQKDEIKTLVHAIMAEQQSAEEESEEEAADEAEEEEDDEGSEDGGAAAAAPKKARKPQASDGPQTSWELSEKLMQFLGTTEAEMDFKKAQSLVQDYLKTMPKDVKDARKYACDDALFSLFGVKKIGIFGVGKHLKKHMKKWTIELAAAAPLSNSDDEEEEEEQGSSSSSKKKKALSAAAAGGGKKRAAPAASGGAASKKKKKAAGKKGAEENGEEKKKRAPGGFATFNYDLSPSLQLVVGGSKQLPRPQVVKQLWVYIKANNLQNPEKKMEIICDANLKAVFSGENMVTAFSMNKYISQHLTKPEK